MKKLSYLFIGLAILLSDLMCACVAYSYCNMLWSIRCAGASAPASTAFLLAIPFAVGIAICAVLGWVCRKRGQK